MQLICAVVCEQLSDSNPGGLSSSSFLSPLSSAAHFSVRFITFSVQYVRMGEIFTVFKFFHKWIIYDLILSIPEFLVLSYYETKEIIYNSVMIRGTRSRWPDRIVLWSDHLWAHICSRCPQNTSSGKGSERTFAYGQWTGTCLIRDHFGLGRSDQNQFQAHSMIREQVKQIFFIFLFFFWQMLTLLSVNNTTAFWSEPHWKPDGVDQNQVV